MQLRPQGSEASSHLQQTLLVAARVRCRAGEGGKVCRGACRKHLCSLRRRKGSGGGGRKGRRETRRKSHHEDEAVLCWAWTGRSAFCFLWKEPFAGPAAHPSPNPTLVSLTHSPLFCGTFIEHSWGESSPPSVRRPGGLPVPALPFGPQSQHPGWGGGPWGAIGWWCWGFWGEGDLKGCHQRAGLGPREGSSGSATRSPRLRRVAEWARGPHR